MPSSVGFTPEEDIFILAVGDSKLAVEQSLRLAALRVVRVLRASMIAVQRLTHILTGSHLINLRSIKLRTLIFDERWISGTVRSLTYLYF